MKIAVYSGSFDPIHTGHAMVAQYVAQWGGVDEVWLMVSRLNPLKEGLRMPAPDEARLAMAHAVAQDCHNVRVSDFEMGLPLPSYTYATLCALRRQWPQHQFVLVVGSDNWAEFSRWRNSEEIIAEFGLLVYPRPGYDAVPDALPANVAWLSGAPTAQISSSFIREAAAKGANLNFFVPKKVFTYIQTHNLYR